MLTNIRQKVSSGSFRVNRRYVGAILKTKEHRDVSDVVVHLLCLHCNLDFLAEFSWSRGQALCDFLLQVVAAISYKLAALNRNVHFKVFNAAVFSFLDGQPPAGRCVYPP